MARSWDMCTSALSEVKELTPEWYTLPDFLTNVNNFGFGKAQVRFVVRVLPIVVFMRVVVAVLRYDFGGGSALVVVVVAFRGVVVVWVWLAWDLLLSFLLFSSFFLVIFLDCTVGGGCTGACKARRTASRTSR